MGSWLLESGVRQLWVRSLKHRMPVALWRVNKPYDGCIGGVIFLIAPTLGHF